MTYSAASNHCRACPLLIRNGVLLIAPRCGEALGPQPQENNRAAVADYNPATQPLIPPLFCFRASSDRGCLCKPIAAQSVHTPTMPFSTRAPSRALLSHLRRSPLSPSPCLRSLASRQIRCESTEQKPAGEGRSFKGQLYESTAARLARERTERTRFSRDRKEPSGARNIALTFGMVYAAFL